MRRKKGSWFIEKHDGIKNDQITEKYPYVCSPEDEKLFSKFILATRSDVADILTREQKELVTDVDESCPEYVFIQQSLELLKERMNSLGDIEQKDKTQENNVERFKETSNLDGVTEVNYETQEISLQQNYSDNNESNVDIKTSQIGSNETMEEVKIDVEELYETSSNNDTSSCSHSQILQKSSSKFYYFYQSDDGQNIYLHPLNVKMLQACYGCLADAPTTIEARIIQKEQHSMDEDHRRKFTCLGHLPLTCQFSVVEIELQPPYVTEDILKAFKNDILFRKKERQRRAREEREREKHINAINDRQMGKLIESTANINITSCNEFPMVGQEKFCILTIIFYLLLILFVFSVVSKNP